MKKLFASLLVGLSLVGLVGCGAAPETTTEVNEPEAIDERQEDKKIDVEGTINNEEAIDELADDALNEDTIRENFKDITDDVNAPDFEEKKQKSIKEEVARLVEKQWKEKYENASALEKKKMESNEEEIKLVWSKAYETFFTQIIDEMIEDQLAKEAEENKQALVIEEKAPVQETKKESPYLVEVITQSEAYTWEIYDIITKGGDLGRIETICANMIELLDGVTMEDCEYEGEYYAVQNLKKAYLNMVTTVGPATMHGIDLSADLPDAYNKINNDTLFLVNELNN